MSSVAICAPIASGRTVRISSATKASSAPRADHSACAPSAAPTSASMSTSRPAYQISEVSMTATHMPRPPAASIGRLSGESIDHMKGQ